MNQLVESLRNPYLFMLFEVVLTSMAGYFFARLAISRYHQRTQPESLPKDKAEKEVKGKIVPRVYGVKYLRMRQPGYSDNQYYAPDHSKSDRFGYVHLASLYDKDKFQKQYEKYLSHKETAKNAK